MNNFDIRKFLDKIIKHFFFILASLSTIIIFLIFLFLFKESSNLIGENHLEFGTKCIVHPQNPLKEIKPKDLLFIKNDKIVNWLDFGWKDREINLYDYDMLEDPNQSIANLVANDTFGLGIIYDIDYKQLKKSNKQDQIKILKVDKISIGSFLFGTTWMPTGTPTNMFGIMPLLLGSIWVMASAILLSVPISIGCAIFVAEIATGQIKEILKPIIEILAGIPSVVYGFFGLVIVVPFVKDLFNLSTGETAISGAIMLSIMCLPTIISISEDAISSVPKSVKEASLALGATKWQTIFKVILPSAKSGIIAAVILGIGRAIGETMTVLMVTGNAAIMPTSLLQPVRTLTATIAAELGEAPQNSNHFYALFGIAAVLFLMTFVINFIAELIINKKQKA